MEQTSKSPGNRRSAVQGATTRSLEIMLTVLGERTLSPVQWMQECQQRSVGLRAFCEGVPLLSHSTLITLIVVSWTDGGDRYGYRRILE